MQSIVTVLARAIRIVDGDFAFVGILGDRRLRLLSHSRTYFCLVLSGTPVLLDEVTGQRTEMNPGEYAFLLHDHPHSIGTADARASAVWRYFDNLHDNDIPPSIALGSGAERCKFLCGNLQLDVSMTPALLRILPNRLVVTSQGKDLKEEAKRMIQARCISINTLMAATQSPGGTEYLKRYAEGLLVDAVRMFARDIALHPDAAIEMRGATQIIEVLQRMNNEISRRWSVSSLAASVNMSRSAFAAAFKHAVGKAPLDHLTELRMQLASQLLKNGRYSVKQIAHHVGYTSKISFARVFKRHFGVTSTEYRNASGLNSPDH